MSGFATARASFRSPEVLERVRRWSPGASVGLIFLLFPAIEAVTGDYPLPGKVLALASMVLTGVAYLFIAPWAMTWALPAKVWLLVGMLVVSFALWPVAGSNLVVVWIFTGIVAGAVMSMRQTTVVAITLAVGMLLASLTDGQPANWELAGALVGLSCWMCAFIGNITLTQELRDTRRELADAAVVAERERIGRDLHDILGHSLTTIAVKAGLARRLIEQGADGSLEEIADVERLAREALTDVRATASGYRQVSLGSELAVAATVLRAAGITASLPGAVDLVDPSAREVLGYVTREAVTNVVRHSGADRCSITVGPNWLEVRDNGAARSAPSERPGSGLQGLRERVQEAGGLLEAGPLRGGGFRVRVSVPTPLPAPDGPPPGRSVAAGTAG